jgi:hypothetical protein
MEYDVSTRQANLYPAWWVGEEGTNHEPIGEYWTEMHDHLARLKTGLA